MYGAGQLKIMIVGGPNSREDFHIEEGEVRSQQNQFQLKAHNKRLRLLELLTKKKQEASHRSLVGHSSAAERLLQASICYQSFNTYWYECSLTYRRNSLSYRDYRPPRLGLFQSRYLKQNYETWGIISHMYAIYAVLDTLSGACPTRPSTQSSLGMLWSYGISL